MTTIFHRFRHLTLIVASTAALAVTALSAASVASASAPVHRPGTTITPVVATHPQAVAIQAFPTGGKGSGSEKTCQLYTDELQADQTALNQATGAGEQEAADRASSELQNDTNSALDAGCAVID